MYPGVEVPTPSTFSRAVWDPHWQRFFSPSDRYAQVRIIARLEVTIHRHESDCAEAFYNLLNRPVLIL